MCVILDKQIKVIKLLCALMQELIGFLSGAVIYRRIGFCMTCSQTSRNYNIVDMKTKNIKMNHQW